MMYAHPSLRVDSLRQFKDSLVVFLLTTLARLPFPLRSMLGNSIGRLLWFLNVRGKQVALQNLSLCFPEWSEHKRRSIAYQRMKTMAAQALEMANMWLSDAESNNARFKSVQGEQAVREALQAQGVILLGPHVGNWECIGLYLSKLHAQSLAMYQPPKNAKLGEIIYAGRQSTGISLVPTDRRGVMRVLKALRNQQLVAILPDQEPPVTSGVFAPFFGVQALTMRLVSNLLQKTDAKAFWAYAYPEGDGFNITFVPASDALYSDDTEVSAAALNSDIAKIALLQPEMYQWEYKRFKRRPEGQTRFY